MLTPQPFLVSMTWGRVTTLYRWGCRGTGQPCTVLPSCLNPDGYSFKTDPHSSSPLALIRSAPPTGPVLSAFSCQEHSSSCYRSPQLHPKVAPRSKSQREPLKQESGQCPFPQSPSCPPPHPPQEAQPRTPTWLQAPALHRLPAPARPAACLPFPRFLPRLWLQAGRSPPPWDQAQHFTNPAHSPGVP